MTALLELLKSNPEGQSLSVEYMIVLLLSSTLLGLILVGSTFLASKLLKTSMLKGKSDEDPQRQLLSSANQLFLCVGLTGVMLLVNENIVRAFAVIAALTLVRFRVRLDGGGISASLLFSVLAGMACGLGELAIAWTVSGVYVILLTIVVLAALAIKPKN